MNFDVQSTAHNPSGDDVETGVPLSGLKTSEDVMFSSRSVWHWGHVAKYRAAHSRNTPGVSAAKY